MSTGAEKSHMGRVAQLSCAVCGEQPVVVHHIRDGQGMAQRSSNWLTVPLCPSCHIGPHGVHGDRAMMKIQKLEELDLLADTIRRLA